MVLEARLRRVVLPFNKINLKPDSVEQVNK